MLSQVYWLSRSDMQSAFKVSFLFHAMTAAAAAVEVQDLHTSCINSHDFCAPQTSSLLLSILAAIYLMCFA